MVMKTVRVWMNKKRIKIDKKKGGAGKEWLTKCVFPCA